MKTIPEKCEVILKEILSVANQGKDVVFCKDKGDWTAAVYIGSEHFQVGKPKESFDLLVENLYDYFTSDTKSQKKQIKENKKK